LKRESSDTWQVGIVPVKEVPEKVEADFRPRHGSQKLRPRVYYSELWTVCRLAAALLEIVITC
jgi:hypothetical protein